MRNCENLPGIAGTRHAKRLGDKGAAGAAGGPRRQFQNL
jgi:hypothetical protein